MLWERKGTRYVDSYLGVGAGAFAMPGEHSLCLGLEHVAIGITCAELRVKKGENTLKGCSTLANIVFY